MENVKITIALIIAVVLQWTLRNIAEPLAYIDFPLIIIVLASLHGESIKSIFFATFAGIAVDALSGGLLGASGFAKTLVAYMVSELSRRVYLDNVLLRIPVIAGACLVSELLYFGVHIILGQTPPGSPFVIIAYTVLGTTITGTVVYILFDAISAGRIRGGRRRDSFPARRQTRRRNPIRLGK